MTHAWHSTGSTTGAEGSRGFTQHLGRLGWLRGHLRGDTSYTVTQRSWERKTKFGGFLPFKPGTGAASLLPRSVDRSKSLGHRVHRKGRRLLPLSACRPGSSLLKISIGTTDPGNKGMEGQSGWDPGSGRASTAQKAAWLRGLGFLTCNTQAWLCKLWSPFQL